MRDMSGCDWKELSELEDAGNSSCLHRASKARTSLCYQVERVNTVVLRSLTHTRRRVQTRIASLHV